MIKAIVFDLGLTLVESRLLQQIYHSIQLVDEQITLHDVSMALHLVNKRIMKQRYLGDKIAGVRSKADYLQLILTQLRSSGFDSNINVDCFNTLVNSMNSKTWQPFSFTHQTLADLQDNGFRLGLISNWNHTCRDVLDANGLSKYFDTVIISSEVGIEKPEPEIFRLCLNKMSLCADEVVYVGDNYYDDVLGAKSLGIPAILLNPFGSLGIEDIDYPYICSDIREVSGVVKSWN